MKKPELKTKTYYDYLDCVKYLKTKHKVSDASIESFRREYLCEVGNGEDTWLVEESILEDRDEDFDHTERTDKAFEILNIFFDEFGIGEKGKREITFNVWW